MKRTAAVIVTYNRKAMLQRCCGLCVPNGRCAGTVVIDNASTDSTADWWRS